MRKLLLLLLLLIPQVAHAILPNYCRRFQLPGWWGSGEYMLVWRKKRFYPPLVTTSPLGTDFEMAGVLGLPTTSILFGDEHVGNSPESGCRFDAGFWLTRCIGFGATWTAFGKENFNFSRESNGEGVPILAVPFFDADNGMQDAALISYPGLLAGNVDVNTTNNIWAADLYARWRFWNCNCWHVDFLGGFRYTRLTDNLDFTTTFADIDPTSIDFGLAVDTFDNFNTENTFYSGLVGVTGEYRYGRWAFQAAGRFGIGNMVKKTIISGRSFLTFQGDVIDELPEGIFTTPSNFGTHSRNSFQVVSEAEAHIGVYVWSNLMVTAGYHFMYWPKVFLAGDQVDTNFSADGPQPRFLDRDSNFWTQSLTVGIYFLY